MTGSTRAVLCLLALVPLGVSCGSDDSTGPVVPAKIILIPNQPLIGQGLTLQLTATVVDATGHSINGERVSFSSGSPGIVKISPTGLMTSQGPLGDALITADDNGLTDTVRVRVTQRVGAVSVTPNPLRMHRNTTSQLFPSVTDVVGNPMSGTGLLSFNPSDPSIATVNQFGLVTAVGPTGTESITVAVDTFEVDVPVTVYVLPTTLQVTPLSVVLRPGGSKQLAVEVLDSLGAPIAGSVVTYTNHDPALFTISNSGLVTAKTATGAGIVSVQSGTLSQDVSVLVGNGIAGVLTGTTQLGTAGYGVAVGPGGEVFVGLLNDASVVHGTLPSHSLAGQLLVGDLPLGMTINPAGTRAYVAIGDLGQVAVVDVTSNTVLAPITGFGSTPFTVAVSPNNQILYVGTDGQVYFVDATTSAFLDSVPAATASHLAVHPSQPLLYASMNSAGTVVEINTTTRQISRTFTVGGTVQGVGVSPTGDRLYIANESGLLQVWDLSTGVETDRIPLLGGGFGIGVTADVIVVAESSGGQIEVFDRASLIRRSVIGAGGTPRRVAINSAGTVAVVANEAGWVDFIE